MVNLDKCFQRFKLWHQQLPRFKHFYAIKANNDPVILKLYSHLGTGFDCASTGEIEQILSLGVSPDRIIFANPCKDKLSLKHACEKGVYKMTCDNDYELRKIKQTHSKARVLLRIKTNDSSAKWPLGIKFGADFKRSLELIDLAHQLEIDLAGVAFHVGCSNLKPNFREEIQNCRKLFDYALEKYGVKMNLIDIGGGFTGLEYEDDIFRQTAFEINNAVSEFFPIGLFSHVQLIAEPGRFLCESALTLCTKIIGMLFRRIAIFW